MEEEVENGFKYLIYVIGGLLLAFVFLFGAYTRNISTNVEKNNINYSQQLTSTKFVVKKTENQSIFGGIVPALPNNKLFLNNYFSEIADKEKPNTVVLILQSTDSLTELEEIIKNHFPNIKIDRYFIGYNSEPLDNYHLARKLANTDFDKAFVLGVVELSQAKDQHIANLQNTTIKSTSQNLDLTTIKNLNSRSIGVLQVLYYYFNFKGALNANNTNSTNQPFIYFSKGENANPNKEITLVAFGDVMLDRGVRNLMDNNGLDYPFEKIGAQTIDLMKGVNYVFANLEGPIKTTYVPSGKTIHFRFKPDTVDVIKKAGINIVSIANNHSQDQGNLGFEETKQYLRKGGIFYFGHPRNEDNENVFITNVDETKIAFIGFDDTIFKIDQNGVSNLIKEVHKNVDYVIISIHWGVEYVHQPNQRQKDLAHSFIDSGADIVLGHHPHVVQTMEIYNEKPIFYSLGNFVFDQWFSVDTQEGLSVALSMNDEDIEAYLFPYKIPKSQPVLMNEEEKAKFLEKFISWGDYDEELTEKIKSGRVISP